MEGTSPTLPFRLPDVPPPVTPPVPLEAWFDEGDEAAFILFDAALDALGAFDASTFTIHRAGQRYETGDVSFIDDTTVRVAGVNPVAVAGEETIDYDAVQETLVGAEGGPVASFAGFPCPTA